MTDQQAISLYEAMREHFGDRLPNIDQQPKEFAYYVKLFKNSQGQTWNEILADTQQTSC